MKCIQPIMLMIIFAISLVGCQNINQNTIPSNQLIFQSTAEKSTYLNLQGCLNQFYQKNPPKVPTIMHKQSQALCYNDFAILYSGITRTPIWSAEYITRQRLVYAKDSHHFGQLYQESRLPQRYQNSIDDFYHDEQIFYGFVTPQSDKSHQNAQYDSFSLANAIPQHRTFYYHVWLQMEHYVRHLVENHGNAYVVTGAIFANTDFNQLHQQIVKPSHLYKAIYLPDEQQALVLISPNDNQRLIQQWTIQELQNATGIDPFPDLPNVIKHQPFTLKLPI